MKTPIEMMLDGVEWREADPVQQEGESDGLPYATHEGVLEIAGVKLRCYRLNTGQAIFNADDIAELFGL
jgi:hypothetical protein